jgi:class 3 adenylate cyclase
VLAQYLFVAQGIWLDVVAPMLTIAVSVVSITVLRFMTEEKQAREIRSMFSSYVSPRIVAELIKDPSKATLGGQRRELTMLFSDAAGFTSFSEKHSAEEVVARLDEYLGAMTEVVFRWNGTLDKFVGDAIVVFWGRRSTSRTMPGLLSAVPCVCGGGWASFRRSGKRRERRPWSMGSGSTPAWRWWATSGRRGRRWTIR